MNEVRRMVHLLENLFRGPRAWHGPPIVEILEGIDDRLAVYRPSPSVHNIAELVGHMTAWRGIVTEALLQGRYDNVISPEHNFPALQEETQAGWARALKDLHDSQERLVEAVKNFPENRLDRQPSGTEYTYSVLVHGLMQHDLYHAGQIVLLQKMGTSE